MKKITFLILILCLSLTSVKAQFVSGQTLPLDYNVFFRAAAMGTDPTLEAGTYSSTTATIMQDQWNKSGKTTAGEGGGASPTVEANTLGYSNYIDNQKGKTIIFTAITTAGTLRSSPYSLTANNEYTGATFYVGMLVNFSSVTGSGVDFFAFDSNHTGNAQRGRIFIKASTNSGFYNAGIGFSGSGDVLTWSGDLAFGTTYFFVASISVAATGTETIKLYKNPVLGSLETDNTPVNSGTYTAALLKLRALKNAYENTYKSGIK